MGMLFSSLLSSSIKNAKHGLFVSTENVEEVDVNSISFNSGDDETTLRTMSMNKSHLEGINMSDGSDEVIIEEPISFRKWDLVNLRLKLKTTVYVKNLFLGRENLEEKSEELVHKPPNLFSPRPMSELDAAAVKIQKVYKSYRTRRNLADCAVVIEELWWKDSNSKALKCSSISACDIEKPETAVSLWARARTRAAKVGKGLSKDEKAQQLSLKHWLEAIDPRHRYGHNLHLYYDVWFFSGSSQPFFYWLDVGDGKEINLEKCPRSDLQGQCIKYLGPKERKAHEVIVESGKLVYRQNGMLVDTVLGSKWIFVLSTLRILYVGEKKKGLFQHSSFLAGGAAMSAGRFVAHNGVLEAIWPYSGHYRPTEENFMEVINFLEEHHLDLTNVKRYAVDDDVLTQKPKLEVTTDPPMNTPSCDIESADTDRPTNDNATVIDLRDDKRLSCKWTTGAGPRIKCVREYPAQLQAQALGHVNLSPRIRPGTCLSSPPIIIPSPRPSPKVHLSPRLACMGLLN